MKTKTGINENKDESSTVESSEKQEIDNNGK